MPTKIQLRLSLSRRALDLVDAARKDQDCDRSDVIEGAILQALDPNAEDLSRYEALLVAAQNHRTLLLKILAKLDALDEQSLEAVTVKDTSLTLPANPDASVPPIASYAQIYTGNFQPVPHEEEPAQFEPPPSQEAPQAPPPSRRSLLGRLIGKGDSA